MDNINVAAANRAGVPPEMIPLSSWNPGYGIFAKAPANQISLLDCSATGGCLFDIRNDPAEAYNVALKYPEKLEAMKAKLATLNREHLFKPYRGGDEVSIDGCQQMRNKGFVGPWYQMDEWVMESEIVSAPLIAGRGVRGASTCQGKIDGFFDCAGTKEVCDVADTVGAYNS